MSDNRQKVTFPFNPHLAQYLFYTLKNKPVESDEFKRYRDVDINLSSIHGQIIRLILERADYPGIKEIKRGFTLTVGIPKRDYRKKLFEDGRYQELTIDAQAVELINHLYQIEFENHFVSYIAGRVAGEGRGGMKNAIEHLIKTYHLQDTEYNFDRIVKMYQRLDLPVKEPVYEKKSATIYMKAKKTKSKTLIDRYIK